MDPIKQLGASILDILTQVRENGGVVDYSKIETDEFLKFPEDGFYLHAKNGAGNVSDCRIYFESIDNYFPAKLSTRGEFSDLSTLEDFVSKLGAPMREIKSVRIPGAEPTLPGKAFQYGDKKIVAYTADGVSVSYIHIKSS